MKDEILNILKIDQSKLSSINQFLKIVSDYANSIGIILWELNPTIDYLFVVAHTFKDGYAIPPLHKLQSVTGEAIKELKTKYVPDINLNTTVNLTLPFWEDLSIKSFFVIPLNFENGGKGSLNIYSAELDAFPIELQKELETLASILPSWYHSLHDRATYTLIKKVDAELKEAESSYIKSIITKEKLTTHLQVICKFVSETFQSFETSIILKDSFKSGDIYENLASTWENSGSKSTYHAGTDDGLTGWILFHKLPVYISDLIQFENEEQRSIIQKQFKGITWNATGDFKTAIREKLKLRKNVDSLPPMGFMGIPIFIGDEILGVIRCCAALKSPYYFGSKELEILKLIATRVGEVWYGWIQHSQIWEDSNTWEQIIRTTNKLDAFVLQELQQKNPNILSVFKEVLKALPDLIKDAEILDVRLYDSEENILYFACTFGQEWEQGTEGEKQKRYHKKFPVGANKAISAGDQVFKDKQPLILDPIDKEKHQYDETFEKTKRMILAPLLIGDNFLGVLDIRSTKDRRFQSAAIHAVELMAGQLAVYHELFKHAKQATSLQIQQSKTFQDFAHQLRTPIYQARIRAMLAAKVANNYDYILDASLLKHLNATSGLCNKANRVATNLRLFSDLSRNLPLNLEKSVIKSSSAIRLFIEAATDNEVIINPKRGIKINVEKESFYVLDQMLFSFDLKMLEQSISILLDNAVKYSHDNSTIYIFGIQAESNTFQIVVKNKGIAITEKEAIFCKIRGWRSDKAKGVTGEGGGIGLWVLDKILEAHGGSLVVVPTDKDSNTEVKIILANKKTNR